MMKTIKTILWIQFVIGLIGCYISFAYIHWGAMSAAWAFNLRVEFERMKQSPDYHEPPRIRDQSFGQILNDMEAYGHARADVAFYWLLTCGALVVLAVVMLWLLRRTTTPEPPTTPTDSTKP
jgi:hypothetical protein